MQINLYSVRDVKGGIYNPPFAKFNHGMAERDFLSNLRSHENLKDFLTDYELFHIGTYDDSTARVEVLEHPVHVATGSPS